MRSAGSRRRAFIAAMLAVLLSSCGGSGNETATASRDQDGADSADSSASRPAPSDNPASKAKEVADEPVADISLAGLKGDVTVRASNPRLVATSGVFDGGEVAIEGGALVVRSGDATSSTPVEGTVSVSCGDDSCDWSDPAGQLLMVEAGNEPLRLVHPAFGTPPSPSCDQDTPAEAWVVNEITDSSLSYTAMASGGHGGGDGCANSYVALFDVMAEPA